MENYEFFNGFGGFVCDGREYEILLDGNNRPPAPWINVISNKDFGFQISESGQALPGVLTAGRISLHPGPTTPSVTGRGRQSILWMKLPER